jgi:hypothetical protein
MNNIIIKNVLIYTLACALMITSSTVLFSASRVGSAVFRGGSKIIKPSPRPKPPLPTHKPKIPPGSGKPKTTQAAAGFSQSPAIKKGSPGKVSGPRRSLQDSDYTSDPWDDDYEAKSDVTEIALQELSKQIHIGNELINSFFLQMDYVYVIEKIKKTLDKTVSDARAKELAFGIIHSNAQYTKDYLFKLANIDPSDDIESKFFKWQTVWYKSKPLVEFIIFPDQSMMILVADSIDYPIKSPFRIKDPIEHGMLARALPMIFSSDDSLINMIPEEYIAEFMKDITGKIVIENSVIMAQEQIDKKLSDEWKEKTIQVKEFSTKLHAEQEERRIRQIESLKNEINQSDVFTPEEKENYIKQLTQEYISPIKVKNIRKKFESEKTQKITAKKIQAIEERTKIISEVPTRPQDIRQKKPSDVEPKEIPSPQAEITVASEQARLRAEAERTEILTDLEELLQDMLKSDLYDPEYIRTLQSESIGNLKLTPAELDDLLEQYSKDFGIKRNEYKKALQEAQARAEQEDASYKEKLDNLLKEIEQDEVHAKEMNDLEKDLESVNRDIETAKQQNETTQQAENKVKELEAQQQELQQEYTEKKQAREKQQERINEAQQELQNAQQEEAEAAYINAQAKLQEAQNKVAQAEGLKLQAQANIANNQAELELAAKDAAQKQSAADKAAQEVATQQKQLEDLQLLRQQLEAEAQELKKELDIQQQKELEATQAEQRKQTEIEQAKLQETLTEKKATELAAQEAAAKAQAEKEAAEIAVKEAKSDQNALASVAKQAAGDLAQEQQNIRDLVQKQEQAAREKMKELTSVKKETVKDLEQRIEQERDIAERRQTQEQAEKIERAELKDELPSGDGDAQQKRKTPPMIPQEIKDTEPTITPPTPPSTRKKQKLEKETVPRTTIPPQEPTITSQPQQPPAQVRPSTVSPRIPSQPERSIITPTRPTPRPSVTRESTGPQPGSGYRPTSSVSSPTQPISSVPESIPSTATTPYTTSGFEPTRFPDFRRITISPIEKKEILEDKLIKEERAEDLTLWERLLARIKTGLPSRATVQEFLANILVGKARTKTPQESTITETEASTEEKPDDIQQPAENPTITFIKNIPTKVGTMMTNAIDYIGKLFGY